MISTLKIRYMDDYQNEHYARVNVNRPPECYQRLQSWRELHQGLFYPGRQEASAAVRRIEFMDKFGLDVMDGAEALNILRNDPASPELAPSFRLIPVMTSVHNWRSKTGNLILTSEFTARGGFDIYPVAEWCSELEFKFLICDGLFEHHRMMIIATHRPDLEPFELAFAEETA